MKKGVLRSLWAVAVLATFQGCSTGERPFMLVQVCLANDQGITDLVKLLQSTAASDHMTYIDRSVETLEEIRRANKDQVLPKPRLLNVGLRGQDGIGLGVANLGMPPYQVAVGFSNGTNSEAAKRFADKLVSRFSQRWVVEKVPTGEGARGIKTCRRP